MNTIEQLLNKTAMLFAQEKFVHEPHELYDPIAYTLTLGGKRIRPVMLMAAHEMFGGDADAVAHAAVGIEAFHNFTLLHDDLMDRSPIRRGQPTVYRKWNENVAILSGDTMFALAWRYFLAQPTPRLHEVLKCFSQTAIEVCEGQQYDMNFERRDDVSLDEYMDMIRLKTAVLLAGALKIGALYANAAESDMESLYDFGINLGMAFQLQDDLLDAYGDVAVFGKQTGTDIRDNKKTYLLLRALQVAPEPQRVMLKQLFAQSPEDPTQKIGAVLDIYNSIGIQNLVEEEIAVYFYRARRNLDAIALNDDRKQTLRNLAEILVGRKH